MVLDKLKNGLWCGLGAVIIVYAICVIWYVLTNLNTCSGFASGPFKLVNGKVQYEPFADAPTRTPPDARASVIAAPDTRAPDARAPDTRAPDARAPDAKTPTTGAPTDASNSKATGSRAHTQDTNPIEEKRSAIVEESKRTEPVKDKKPKTAKIDRVNRGSEISAAAKLAAAQAKSARAAAAAEELADIAAAIENGTIEATIPVSELPSTTKLVEVTQKKTIGTRLLETVTGTPPAEATHVVLDEETGTSIPVLIDETGQATPSKLVNAEFEPVDEIAESGSILTKIVRANPFRAKSETELAIETQNKRNIADIPDVANKEAKVAARNKVFGKRKPVAAPVLSVAPVVPDPAMSDVTDAVLVSDATLPVSGAPTIADGEISRFTPRTASGRLSYMNDGIRDHANMDTVVTLHHTGNLGVGLDRHLMRHEVELS